MDRAQKEKLTEKARKTLRKYTRQKKIQAVKKDELKRQIAENEKRLLNLALINSNSE